MLTSMLRRLAPTSVVLCLLALAAASAAAADGHARESKSKVDTKSEKPDKDDDKPGKSDKSDKDDDKPSDDLRTTHHQVTIGGKRVSYAATTGTIVMKDEDGKAKAKMFFTAYTREGAGDPSVRPVTFTFNGGPGSSSVWLHLGAFGPRRVALDDDAKPIAPPYRLIDNASSLLDVTDLVFIDPVTTGYSRAVPVTEDKAYHGVKGDVESVGDFIRLWTTRYSRWSSPKFLAGESYGTTRAAGLSGYLQERYGMYLNGIILISSVLDFSTLEFEGGNDLPYALYLPTYTATAWYHHRLPSDLQGDLAKALRESEDFAGGSYTTALMKGDAIPEGERATVATELARLTGLSRVYVERSNLRIRDQRFFKELLRDEDKTVGRLDSRFTGRDSDSAGETPDTDPSYSAILGPYTATLNDYVRRELRFESDLPYEILTGRVHPWSFAEYENRYVNVSDTLAGAMRENPALKVFVACGHFDLATPYFAAKRTFDHLGVEPELHRNITLRTYEAGHMMYVHGPSLVTLKGDLAEFVHGACPAGLKAVVSDDSAETSKPSRTRHARRAAKPRK